MSRAATRAETDADVTARAHISVDSPRATFDKRDRRIFLVQVTALAALTTLALEQAVANPSLVPGAALAVAVAGSLVIARVWVVRSGSAATVLTAYTSGTHIASVIYAAIGAALLVL